MTAFIVAAIKPWNVAAFHERALRFTGDWSLVERPEDLTFERLEALAPRYVFFPHWSWMVAKDITDAFDCICFHMTDLPYGRGGSPLQNLILRGHRSTVISALRMAPELDAGPVLMKRDLSLEGSANEIFSRSATLVYDMIEEIARTEPVPVEQEGAPVYFERRRPEQSVLPDTTTLAEVYDHIRMLDAPTYPAAFVERGPLRFEFSEARLEGDHVTATVKIIPNRED